MAGGRGEFPDFEEQDLEANHSQSRAIRARSCWLISGDVVWSLFASFPRPFRLMTNINPKGFEIVGISLEAINRS